VQVSDEEGVVGVQWIKRDAPLDRGLFNVHVPYSEKKMIKTCGNLGVLRAMGLRFNEFAAFF
jgi:hypothetical protein